MPFDIPDNWTWIRLTSIATISAGGTPDRGIPKYWNGDIPWLKISDVTSANKYVRKASEFITKDGMDNSSAKIMQKGTILYTIFATIGEVGVLDFDATCNQAIAGINTHLKEVDDYLYFLLINLKDYMKSISKGCAQFNINQKILKETLIALPPIEEQMRIVKKLDSFNPLLDSYESAEEKLSKLEEEFPEKLKKSILQYAIEGKLVKQDPNDEPASVLLERIKAEKEKLIKEGKIKRDKNESYIYQGDDKNYYEQIDYLPPIPSNWKYIKLSFVIDVARGGSPRPIQDYLTTKSDGYNWIKIGDTDVNSKYITSTKEKIKKEGLYKTRLVHPGDFLLTNSMSFGHPYILKIDGCIHDGWLVLSDSIGVYDKDFLYYLLSSPYIYKSFCSSVGGSVVKNLNSDKVSNTIIPLISMNEQIKIANKLEKIFMMI